MGLMIIIVYLALHFIPMELIVVITLGKFENNFKKYYNFNKY